MRQTLKQKLFKASLLAAALAALPAGVNAAGLGKLTVLSALGQPLRAELDLTATRDELSSLSARIAPVEAFKQAGIEYQSALVGVRFTLDKRPNGSPYLRMVSDRPVNEPFLDALIELNWASGRLVREYTFLLDPPESLQRPAAASVAPPEKREAAPAATVAHPAPAPKAPETKSLPASEGKPPAKAEAPRPAGEAGSRTVKKGETLAKIAAESKPEGVNLDQMLVALFKGNKEAFDGNNMNRLKAGKILNVPDAAAVAEAKPEEARKVVQAHAADFNAYRKKLAAVAGGAEKPAEAAPKQEVTGKIAPKVEDKVPAAAPGKDKLEVSRTEQSKDAKAVQGRISALEEDLVARDKALKEANSRIADLEKNLSDLKKLAELKNQGAAELQKQAQAAKAPPAAPVPAPVAKGPEAPPAKAPEPPPAAKAVEKPVEAPKAVEAPKPVAPVEAPKPPAEAPKAAEPPPAAEAPKQAEPPKPVDAPKPPPPAKKPAAPPPPPPPPPSFTEENPEIVFGGGALVALLAGYFGFSAWRKKKKGRGGVTEGDLSANSVFGTTGGQSVDTSNSSIQTDFSQSGIGAIDADEGVDPVAEADVYMAYGRDAQAEEILLDALKTDPARHAVHLKLLEIYAARKSVKQFETLATDLYGQTGGNGADWEKAAALGRSLDPDNPLYGGKPGEKAVPDLNTTVILSAPPEKVKDTVTMPGELQQMAQAAEVPVAAQPEPPPQPVEEPPASLDFDLDLGSPVVPQPVAAMEPAPEPEPLPTKAEDAGGLDFDLDLGATVVVPAAQATPEPEFSGASTVVMPEPAEPPPEESPPSLDIDFAVTDTGIPGPKPVAEVPAEDTNVIDFDLDLSPAAAAPAEEVASIELERSNVMGEKALDFNFDLDSAPAASAAAEVPPPALDLSDISLDLGEPAVAAATDAGGAGDENPEVATKLELAQAYEEMDDKEGARELLQEVLNEGTPAQQEMARERLAKLA